MDDDRAPAQERNDPGHGSGSRGPLLFARYAYPPNQLGYCGPADDRALLEYGAASVVDPGLGLLAQAFSGAWPYLELIAGASGIADPLDHRVVEAYWVGNRLLEGVDMASFGNSLLDRFRRRSGPGWSHLAEAVPAGAVPHHSFHVFGVYPWVGLLRSGPSQHPRRVLDRCRIRWGRVLAVHGEQVVVRYRPLVWDGTRLELGPPSTETATASAGGLGFVADLQPGEWVSLHWDWVCDRLSGRQLAALRHFTLRQLAITNGQLAASGAELLAT